MFRRRNFNGIRRFALISLIALSAFLAPDGSRLNAGQEAAGGEVAQAKTDATAKPTDWERLVYLPYKNLKQVFEKDGAVFMPYSQFLKLWEHAKLPDPKGPPKPPVNAVIAEAKYTGKIEGDVAKLEAEFTIQVLGKPWVEVPLQFGEAAIGKMSASDDKILLQATGNGAYTLLFPKGGEQKVKLELTTRVRTSPDGRSFDFDCPASAITRVDLTVPVAEQTLEIVPASIVTPQTDDPKISRVQANLGATKKIAARWRPRLSTAPVMEVLATVQNIQDIRVADGLVHSHATLVYQILRGQIDQVRIGVPVDHRILDVASAGLKSWKTTKEEKMQVITVDLLGGDAKTINLEIFTERPVPEGAVEFAGIDDAGTYRGIHALGELRENGTLVVGQSPDLALTIQEQSGLVRIEPAEVPESLRRPESQFYKYYTPKIRLQAQVMPVEPRVSVDMTSQIAFRDDELQLSVQSVATIEKAGLFELRFQLPPGIVVDRVDCEQMKGFQTQEADQVLVVSLREKTLGKVGVSITAHLPLDPADKESHSLPLLELLAATRDTGVILVYAPQSLEVIADEQAIQGAQPTRPGRGVPVQLGASRLVSAWNYTRRPDIPVRTERKPTRLTAAVGTTINIRQDLTEVTTLINYQVQFAGIDVFRLAVPEAIAAQVQIESADPASVPLKQKSRAEQAEEGWVTWTIATQREMVGIVPLRVRYDLKPNQAEEARKIAVSPLRILSSPGRGTDAPPIVPAAISGEITVQKDRALSVEAKGNDFEPIDVRELTMLGQDGNLAYRYFKQPDVLTAPFALDLVATKHEIQEVVETVVARALVEAVVTEEKVITFRCRYYLKTSERQRLSIELPKDVEMLDSYVAGKRVELEKDPNKSPSKDHDAFKINVARATASDQPFVMALLFRAPVKENPLSGSGGNVQLLFPQLGGEAEQGHSAVAVQQLKVAIWVPRQFTLVGTPADFSTESRGHIDPVLGAVTFKTSTADLENWFGDSSTSLFAFTPAGRAYQYSRLGTAATIEVAYWRVSWYTWVISGTLLVVAFVLGRTSLENKMTFTLLLGFAAAMWAIRDYDQTLNIIAAARWGLAAGALFWGIQAFNRQKTVATQQPVYDPANPLTAVAALAAVIPPPSEDPPANPPATGNKE